MSTLPRDRFVNREEAGARLVDRLRERLGGGPVADILVLALPTGGVLVGREVARAFAAPLDVFQVRRLPLPENPELAIGAVASGGVRMFNETVIRARGVSEEVVARVAKEEEKALARRESAWRGTRAPSNIGGRRVILVQDGAVTGATLRAAAAAVRTHDPARLVIAVPVVSREAVQALEAGGEEVVCLLTPDRFLTVDAWYDDLEDPGDDEIRAALAEPTDHG